MTWPLRTCFSLAVLAVHVRAVPLALPSRRRHCRVELRDSKDAAVRKKMDFSGVVVWLEPVTGKAPLPPAAHARMVQKDKTFTPHILAIPAGTTVDFPNLDPIFHNAFSK